MDRAAALLLLLGTLVNLVLLLLAFFAWAPIFCSCLVSLMYSLYLFFAHEKSGVHHAQEFENRFWTIFAVLFSTALFFAKDSPIAFGQWSPSLGFLSVFVAGYGMHIWDRHLHRVELGRQIGFGIRRGQSALQSLNRLRALGIPVEDQLAKINSCLSDLDQLLISSTINNIFNPGLILRKEREIISVFEEAESSALNYIVSHVKLGLLFYKIKDHPRIFSGHHRTELVELLAVARISVLNTLSRVIVLHALQIMKLPANRKAEYWVRNIFLNTHQDELSELKTLTDAKGDYFCTNKLIYEDIRSELVRQDILSHIRKEAKVQQAHMDMGTKKSKERRKRAWRKVLSDVDDTLTCSGGSYPTGIDKRFGRKVVYPGVLAFYRELDLGANGPEEWPAHRVGNLVFLSARPHVYKDVAEKPSFAKFEKLRHRGQDGRGMHTIPSLLAGDITSGRNYIVNNDMEPLALKKLENFKRYAAIYPEFTHVFICDNGQGDVRASELMFDAYPQRLEAVYVHRVQEVGKTHGYAPERWRQMGFKPVFFQTYPDAALHAARRKPPLIRLSGLQRVCQDAVKDFYLIQTKQWPSQSHKANRRDELNQGLWRCNHFLDSQGLEPVPLLEAEQVWKTGSRVRTPYGIAVVLSFDPIFDLYEVEIDWRPLNEQVASYEDEKTAALKESKAKETTADNASLVREKVLETVHEASEERDGDVTNLLETNESSLDNEAPSPTKTSMENQEKGTSLNEKIHRNGNSELGIGTQSDGSMSSNQITQAVFVGNEAVVTPNRSRIIARVRGSCITKFTPPSIPVLRRTSLFSFWSDGSRNSDAPRNKKKVAFKTGDKCSTPYGPATVVDYRLKDKMLVVDMIGWEARAYLQESSIRPVSKGLFGALLSPFSASETAELSSRRQNKKDTTFSEGKELRTPFGKGTVIRSVPPPQTDTLIQNKGIQKQVPSTLGIRLDSWQLADGSNPMLYCDPNSVRDWQKIRMDGSRTSSTGIINAFGTLVSETVRLMTGPGDSKSKPMLGGEPSSAPKFDAYYKTGAAVSTDYGNGEVRNFRDTDGFYEVALTKWVLQDGSHPVAIVQKDSLSHRIASGCHEGYPVLTSLGLSGKLESVEPTTGVHMVTIPSINVVCYLRPESVLQPLKAAVGDGVLTPYGEGTVRKYRREDGMFEIALKGINAILYAKGESFDRISESVQDGQGSSGMNSWLLRFLFFSSRDDALKERGNQRSRSNSIASVRSNSAAMSQSARSLT